MLPRSSSTIIPYTTVYMAHGVEKNLEMNYEGKKSVSKAASDEINYTAPSVLEGMLLISKSRMNF